METEKSRQVIEREFTMKILFNKSTYDEPIENTMPKLTEKERMQEDLQKAKAELEIAYSGFDNVTDPDLIDCYIYQVNAVLKRYKYLTEKAAELHLLPGSRLDHL